MPHSKGYIADHPALKRHLIRFAAPGTTTGTFPASCSNDHLAGAVLDQNETSGCTGHGTSQTLQVCFAKAGTPLSFRPGPRGIYANARIAELGVGQSLTDSGAEPVDVVATIASKGIEALVEPSPLGYASDVDESNVDTLPTAAELQAEKQHLEPGAYRIDNTSATFIDQLCEAVFTDGAACTGSFVDTAFENYSPATGPVQTVDLNDPKGGGHWLSVTSYRTVTADSEEHTKFGIAVGKRIIRGPNSWGTGWGDKGFYEVVGEDVLTKSCSDCYGFKVQKTTAPSLTLAQEILAAIKAIF